MIANVLSIAGSDPSGGAGIQADIKARPAIPVVLDPVMIAKGGAPLLADDAVTTVRDMLLPLATVVTPNLPEAAHLLGTTTATTRDDMAAQGRALCALRPRAVLMKGGHLDGPQSPDVLVTPDGAQWFEAERTPTKNTHGTGCTLSSALAAHIGKGLALPDAVVAAKAYVTAAIAHADQLTVGTGHGPTHHFAQFHDRGHETYEAHNLTSDSH